jgi:hypothetical protein
VYFSYGDTYGFGTYYLKDVMKVRPDVIQIHETWGFDWSQKKFRKKYPHLVSKEKSDFFDNFNFDNYRFFTNFSTPTVRDDHTISYFGLVFEISKFKGEKNYKRFSCDMNYSWRDRYKLEDYDTFEYGKVYDFKYGDCHHNMAGDFINKGDWESAKTALLKALHYSPNNPGYQENLCKIYKIKGDPELG